MKPYVRIYMNYFGYAEDDFIPCEITGLKSSEIHHIDCRGMGGSKTKDYIENLMAVSRECHEKYGDKKQYNQYLTEIHLNFMKNNGIKK